MKDKTTGIRKRIKSFGYAFSGIKTLIKTQPNAQIHLTIAILVVIFGVVLQLSKTEWIFIVFAIFMVLAAEAVNSSIEFLSDFVTSEKHDLIKKAKDLAAGAVLLSAFGAAIIGGLIFFPKLFIWLQNL